MASKLQGFADDKCTNQFRRKINPGKSFRRLWKSLSFRYVTDEVVMVFFREDVRSRNKTIVFKNKIISLGMEIFDCKLFEKKVRFQMLDAQIDFQ